MCRMIAKVSTTEVSIMEEMFLCPTSLHYLSQNGRQPEAPWQRGEHNDGCGLAFVRNGEVEIQKRDKENAWNESYQSVVRDARSKIFIAHNRLATKGLSTTVDAAHPFFYQPADTPYAFSHNGSVKTFLPEAKKAGTSDSNIFLRHIVDLKEQYPSLDISEIVTSIANKADYTSICAFLLTPEQIWIWRIYSERDAEKIALYEASYTLYLSFKKGEIIISSEPLDEGHWMLLPNKTFLHIKPLNGSLQLDYKMLKIESS